jgi:serine/threonine protein kinase/tetratricopeptide (TPR) repeat protein
MPADVKSIFLAAVEKSPADRAAFLDAACGSDAAVRQRIEALLRAHDEPDAGPATGTFLPDPSEQPGGRIGPYKLLQLIGEGGMGAVWMAEQQEPVRRTVAVKVIKAGLDTAQVVARFEAERQALALMDHSNIAKVFDAGVIGSSRPYFVMELVKGTPITRYCDEHRLTPRQRLELFVPVCQAIQHAHQKGVIHRDIKPSNVLVAPYDGRPVPKVIDFGVAKAAGPKLTERTMFTEVGSVVGTLEYMSPEQAELNNLDIDTRADIYSLGVLLYELLTGSPPFTRQQLRGAAFTEMLRIIREVEPPKPSTRLSGSDELPSLAAKRMLEPKRLTRLVHGDLDWIAMKCLEKDRGRRYETANSLAMDIQRYLADEAVLAGPPSARYRLRKFVRRHRGQVLAASTVLLALVGGTVGTTIGLVRARQAEAAAKEQAAAAEQARADEAEQRRRTRQALDDMLSDESLAFLTTQKELLPQQRAFLERALSYYRELAARAATDEEGRALVGRAHYRVGKIYDKLGQFAAAAAANRAALAVQEKLAAEFPAVPEHRRDLANSHHRLGSVLTDLGQRPAAEAEYCAALALQKKLAAEHPAVPEYRRELARSHNDLANLLQDLGQRPAAEAEYRRALAVQEPLAAEYPAVPEYRQALARSHHNLAVLLRALGRYAEAESEQRRALAKRERLAAEYPAVPAYRADLAISHNSLGILLTRLGQRAKADAEYRKALALQVKLAADFPAAPDHAVELGASYCNFGNLVRDRGEPAAALDWFAKAIATLEPVHRAEPRLVNARQYLRNSYWGRATALVRLNRSTEALADFDRALEQNDGSGRTSLRLERTLALARAGEAEKTLAAADELAAAGKLTAGQDYDLACAYALVAAKLQPADADRAAARAVDLLCQAFATGYRDVAHMLKDSDLDSLRRRDDYADLLWDLADRPPAKEPERTQLQAFAAAATREIAAGRTQDALVHLATLSEANPEDTRLFQMLAALQAWFGRDQELAATCRRGLELAKNTTVPETADRVAKACCVLPSADKAQQAEVLALARNAVELGKNSSLLPWFQMGLGMAEYRSGHFAEADAALITAADRAQNDRWVAGTSALYRAMSLFRLGKEDKARQLAIKAVSRMRPLPKDEKNPLAGNAIPDDLILWMAYKEAKALIQF